MKQQVILFLFLIAGSQCYCQNIGIGISNPFRAKLEVRGATGANSAIFGGESSGISLQRDWPGIGYNQYYNNGNKYIGNGFAAVQFLDPNSGNFSMDVFGNGSADSTCNALRRIFTFTPSGIGLIGANYYNANLAVSRGIAQKATACFFGEINHSYFNEDSTQNTYIRAGKTNGKLYINDIPGSNIILSGKVGINTNTPTVPLEVHQTGDAALSIVSPQYFASWQFNVSNTSEEILTLSRRFSSLGHFSGADGSYNNYSDLRLKQNVKALPGIIQKVMSLRPVEYEMIKNNPEHKTSMGFIAQEVGKLFPDLVSILPDTVQGYEHLNNLHSVNYTGFAVLAIKAIQEQQQMIGYLKTSISALQRANETLSKKLTLLEVAPVLRQQ